MKKYLLLVASVLLLAACSPPKYAYYFDRYDYNSGKKKLEAPETRLAESMLTTPELSPLLINQEAVTASAGSRLKKVENVPVAVDAQKILAEKYSAMSKAEKKDFQKELKSEVKKIMKAKKRGESVTAISENKAMEHDLKMALIFGVVAILLTAFYGVSPVFWILGVIALVVAIVFLISWIADQ